MKLWMFKTVAKFPAKGTLGQWIGLMVLAALTGGCFDDIQQRETPEIAGTYTDQNGDTHEITQDSWTILSTFGNSIVWFHIVNNPSNYGAGKNDDTVSFNPGKYSRLDWTFFNGDTFMCTTVFNGNTLDDALAGGADSTDPTTGGCDIVNNFTWTNLTPPLGP